MIKCKIGNRTHTIPTLPSELTLGQYAKFCAWAESGQDLPALVSALSGISQGVLIDRPDIWYGRIDFSAIADSIKNIHNLPHPQEIHFFGKTCKVKPFDTLTVGQRVAVEQLLGRHAGKSGNGLAEIYPQALAIALGHQALGAGWFDCQPELEGEANEVSMLDGIPIVNFFLRGATSTKPAGLRWIFKATLTMQLRSVVDYLRSAFGR